mmetsp:Transcript_1321/g.4500  ORF Transcript_1321/g.4500 Transcript_1321/m.4500 type:complete len:168 (+) Transcript_1321:57-560(+)
MAQVSMASLRRAVVAQGPRVGVRRASVGKVFSTQSFGVVAVRMPSGDVTMKTPGDIIGDWQPSTTMTDKELFYNSVFHPQFFPEPATDELSRPPPKSPALEDDVDREDRGGPPRTTRTTPKLAVKRTFQPSIIRRKRKHGFLARVNSKKGRQILNRRRAKGRHNICA